ncbi:MAG: ABC transporter substrate-binding protein [Spirochaetaceae bacterium]|nr:ABC transporter substrate-binding protein [Spirochaetaceae bacterium]
MKSNKFVFILLLSVIFICSVFAGGKKEATVQPIQESSVQEVSETEPLSTVVEKDSDVSPKIAMRVAALNGPSGIPMAYLFENIPEISGADVTFQVEAGADSLLPKLLKGEVDIGILPPNVAAKVYTKNNGAILVAAVVGQGMLNLITRDKTINSLADLKGKTVSVAGQGATPEYMFRYLLQKNGVQIAPEGSVATENSVALDFTIPASEIAAALLSGKIQYAVVPEPFSTVAISKDSSVIKAIDLQQEYRAVQAAEASNNYPMTVVVVRASFAKDNPEMLRSFLAAYENAISWTNKNPTKAGVLVQNHTLGLMAPIAAKVIPNGAYMYKNAEDSRGELENLFGIFMDFAPEAIGGTLPDDGFYFN